MPKNAGNDSNTRHDTSFPSAETSRGFAKPPSTPRHTIGLHIASLPPLRQDPKTVCRVSLQRARLPLLHPKASGSSSPAIAVVDECASCVTCSLLFHELCTTPTCIHHH